jgi:hypothetical protein
LSITCMTPFATIISVITTCAELTNTFPSVTSTIRLPPCTVGKLSFASSMVSKLEYPTVPWITWYWSIDESCVVDKLPVAEPMAWNAALEGAKMVTSLRPSTVVRRLVEARAPARAVRLLSIALNEGTWGMLITVSIMWRTPPLNVIS